MDTYLHYAEYIDSITTLGPGNRFAVWFQGCCFNCKGCIGKSYKEAGKGKRISVMEMIEHILSVPGIDGVTISGGEPLLQAHALAALSRGIKERSNLSIILYTGFGYEELTAWGREATLYIPKQQQPYIKEILDCTDVLIDGKYVRELDDGRSLVGSSNQHVINLSGYYQEMELKAAYGNYTRKIEMVVKQNKTLLVGVPDRRQHDMWKRLKREVLK